MTHRNDCSSAHEIIKLKMILEEYPDGMPIKLMELDYAQGSQTKNGAYVFKSFIRKGLLCLDTEIHMFYIKYYSPITDLNKQQYVCANGDTLTPSGKPKAYLAYRWWPATERSPKRPRRIYEF